MVATSQPLAALAGVDALRRGGSAADAALAAATVLAVTEPNQRGVGGDLFAIVLRDGEAPVGLNASGRSPAEPGDSLPQLFGPCSVTVPGCPAGWADLAARFSRHGLAAAIEPALHIARGGFVIRLRNREMWEQDWRELEGEAAELFRPAPLFRNPGLADTLELIAAGRYYDGPVAEAIASV